MCHRKAESEHVSSKIQWLAADDTFGKSGIGITHVSYPECNMAPFYTVALSEVAEWRNLANPTL
jgi:hypothetical protein